jgi:hypothetical protein
MDPASQTAIPQMMITSDLLSNLEKYFIRIQNYIPFLATNPWKRIRKKNHLTAYPKKR